MTFRGAVGFSVFVHLVLLSMRPPHGLTPLRAAPDTLEVSYTSVEPEGKNQILPARLTAAPEGPGLVAPARPEKKAEFPGREDLVARPAPPAPRNRLELAEIPPAVPLSPSAVTALPEWEFEVIQHKEHVRTHLKSRMRYPLVQLEGTVRLRLLLTTDGLLQRAEVLAASDPRLTEAALRDAQSAAPYPRFPSALRRRTAAYEFLVRYQPD